MVDGAHAGRVDGNEVGAPTGSEDATEAGAPPGREDHQALLGAAERLLDDVDRALAALDDGSYGTCQRCGQPMPGAELASDPLARACGRHAGVPPETG